MADKIICTSCGGEFEDNLPKCPFCGSMNLSGAEAEYMDKLDDVREDMEELEDTPIEETRKEIRKQGRFLKKTFLVIAVILVGLIVIWGIHEKLYSRYDRDAKADYLWQKENFPMMDQLYQERKYDELVEFLNSDAAIDKPVWEWEHYEMIETYGATKDLQYYFEREQQRDFERQDYVSILCDELRIIGFLYYSDESDEDKEVLAAYAEPYLRDYEERWDMTQEEKDGFDSMLREYRGTYSYAECKKFVKQWYKEHADVK